MMVVCLPLLVGDGDALWDDALVGVVGGGARERRFKAREREGLRLGAILSRQWENGGSN